MGIHGIFKEIGPGQRIFLAKLAANHLIQHDRPFRIAIDVSIWLFQIQSGKGGSNPALRTFYYRLLRLLSLNIHPIFVFDGPHKPMFKRNKKVGGPGVRVASVPEFLAKQLLRLFGFPIHAAPGEAEAECALLQREGIVDAVFSEDVDTLMFGSGVTLRNWSSENSSKSPTHVNVYRATETLETSGLEREGMVLVALMSGGDYVTEGIPGCGPKVACDAARAGFGKRLCALAKGDTEGLKSWREELQHEIRTNESKFFSRRNTTLTIPDDFPSSEVLGYYTHPCVSSASALVRLRETLTWDQEINFASLRAFAADAFDWRCLGGAKKFIRNLAPAMLVRQLRLYGEEQSNLDIPERENREKQLVNAIHSRRNHAITGGELEYRISFVPANLVPIDLSAEDPDDDFVPAGEAGEEAEPDLEDDWAAAAHTQGAVGEIEPGSPSKKRHTRQYFPDQPEKLWMLGSFLKLGCPLLAEDFEAAMQRPKEVDKSTRNRGLKTGKGFSQRKILESKPTNTLHAYAKTTKYKGIIEKKGRERQNRASPPPSKKPEVEEHCIDSDKLQTHFLMPRSTFSHVGLPSEGAGYLETRDIAQSATSSGALVAKVRSTKSSTTTRKRRSPEPSSPAPNQRTLDSVWSSSPRHPSIQGVDVIDLLSPSLPSIGSAGAAATPPLRPGSSFHWSSETDMGNKDAGYLLNDLPATVTKRRSRRSLQRTRSAPIESIVIDDDEDAHVDSIVGCHDAQQPSAIPIIEAIDLLSSPTTVTMLPTVSNCINSRHIEATGRSLVSTSLQIPQDDISRGDASDARKTQELFARFPPPRGAKKTQIELRESLSGFWKESNISTEITDVSCQPSLGKLGRGRPDPGKWRRSGIEILDMTE